MSERFLGESPGVVNVGLSKFRRQLEDSGATVADVEWSPPSGVDQELQLALSSLGQHGAQIGDANERATQRLVDVRPMWTDVRPARDELPALEREAL